VWVVLRLRAASPLRLPGSPPPQRGFTVRASSPLQPLRVFRSAAVAPFLAPRGAAQRAQTAAAPCAAPSAPGGGCRATFLMRARRPQTPARLLRSRAALRSACGGSPCWGSGPAGLPSLSAAPLWCTPMRPLQGALRGNEPALRSGSLQR
jgi:hypothetical protein